MYVYIYLCISTYISRAHVQALIFASEVNQTNVHEALDIKANRVDMSSVPPSSSSGTTLQNRKRSLPMHPGLMSRASST